MIINVAIIPFYPFVWDKKPLINCTQYAWRGAMVPTGSSHPVLANGQIENPM